MLQVISEKINILAFPFDLKGLGKCKTVGDIFELMGVGVKESSENYIKLNDKTIFGERASYRNMFITPQTFNKIYEYTKVMGKKIRRGSHLTTRESIQWCNFAPISNGPRYDLVEQENGGFKDNTLYIATPHSRLHIPTPTPTLEI